MKTNGFAADAAGAQAAVAASAKTALRIDSTVCTVRGANSKDPSGNFSPQQDYATLAADLSRRGLKFEDPEFPATDKSKFACATQELSLRFRWILVEIPRVFLTVNFCR